MTKINKAYGLYFRVSLTSKDVDDLVDGLKTVDAKEKYEVTIDIDNQIKHFTFKEFCERLDIKYLH